MRVDTPQFAARNQARQKSPRFVVRIVYDVDSLALTSHAGIADITAGTILEGVLVEPTVTSQRLKPDDAIAEIGSASFTLVDVGSQFTTEIRERLLDGAGLRGKTVQFYVGFEDLSFTDFMLVATQIVSSVSFSNGVYQIACLDIQRSLRSEVFEPKATTLAVTASATDVTLTLTSTTGFQMVAHGTSYTDAPSATVGYVKIKTEIIRYTGISGNQLTGCTRGVLGTVAAAYPVDPAVAAERREKVTEYIYIELPGPKLALAVLTGSGGLLPAHWHLGISPALVRTADFNAIGKDLWDPADDSKGLVLRFEGLTRTDGKRFLEKEIYLCLGLYSPVYADGTLGLRRMSRVRADAATVMTLDPTNSTQVADLTHDMRALHNVFVVNWSWNGSEFRRTNTYVDAASAAKHGEAETVTLNFKGLHGSRHTDGVIFGLLSMLRDRYAGPPLRLSVTLRHSRNVIEVGDIVRVRYPNVRDFTALASGTIAIDRAFEVQNVSVDHRSGDVSVELFGSTADPIVTAPTQQLGPVASMPDAYYNAVGTQLSTVPGVVIGSNIMTAAPGTPITGNASLTAAGAVFYHLGDLTIAAGVDLKIASNVQLRVRGFLQVNGSINGVAGGLAGVADASQVLFAIIPLGIAFFSSFFETIPGNPGYVGSTRGFDGVLGMRTFVATPTQWYDSRPAAKVMSKHAVSPRLLLSVAGNVLNGLPDDLRGSGGAPGGRAQYYDETSGLVAGFIPGGAGGAGGAGLAIICRGMAFGANGYIDLSGANTTGPVTGLTEAGFTIRPGVGGPGGPGTLLVLLDGSGLSVPDFGTNKFRGKVGTATLAGTPLPQREYNFWNHSSAGTTEGMATPATGFREPDFTTINGADLSGAALTVQHIPGTEVVTPDQSTTVPAPTSLSTESAEQQINVTLGLPAGIDAVELFMAVNNDRTNATEVFDGLATVVPVRVPDGVTRHFWARNRVGALRSDWFPVSPTAGIVGTSVGGLICRGNCEAFNTGVRKNGGAVLWDSDAYSPESYADGVFVSFQASQTNASFMVGLNSDPTTDSSFTSLDYAWFVRNDGTLEVRENGVSIANYGAYTINTTIGIKYDGATVFYTKDGVGVRSVIAPDLTLFVDSSFNAPGAACRNLKYGPLTTAPRSLWVARGFGAVNGTSLQKIGGVDGTYDSDCYSERIYAEGCSLTFQAGATNKELTVGLNTDPASAMTATSIDYAFQLSNAGGLSFSESGTVTAAGFYVASSVLQIKYDGQQVIYLKDGVILRTVQLRGALFFADVAFRHTGARIVNVSFDPLTTAPTIPWILRGTTVATATTAKKIGGVTNTWDADIYSVAAYRAGCAIACVVDSAAGGFMVGLEDNPAAGTDFTFLEFAFWCNPTSTQLQIYESGVSVLNLGAGMYDTTTHLSIVYDGLVVRYLRNGVIVREKAAPDLTLYGRVAFRDTGAAVRGLTFAALSAATPVPFIARSGQIIIGPTSARKRLSASAGWDSDFVSLRGFEQCNIQFKATQTNGFLMVGLNSDPYTDQNYTSIDGAWYMKNDGTLQIYESGVQFTGFGSYTTKTLLGITYDGTNLRYYKDNVLQRTTALAGLTMFADASLHDPGAGVNGLHFGVGSVLPLVDTADLSPFAATELLSFTLLPPSVTGPSCAVGVTTFTSNCGFTGYSSVTPIEVEAQVSFRVLVRELLSAPVTATFTVRAWLEEVLNGAGFSAAVPAFEKTTTAVENGAIVSKFSYAGHPSDFRQVRFVVRLETDGTQHLQANVTNVHMRTALVKR